MTPPTTPPTIAPISEFFDATVESTDVSELLLLPEAPDVFAAKLLCVTGAVS